MCIWIGLSFLSKVSIEAEVKILPCRFHVTHEYIDYLGLAELEMYRYNQGTNV